MNHKYGWKRQLPDHRDHQFCRITHRLALPSSVDLRPQMPAVYDQGQLGSCSANASGAAVEYQSMLQGDAPVMPSRLFIYYNERLIEGTVDQDSGATIRDSIKATNQYGVCPEAEWPYDITQFTMTPDPSCYKDALKDRVLTYEAVAQDTGLQSMKSALAQKIPVIIGFTVYESFETQVVADTGHAPLPGPNEQVLGGHAVLVSGYDDANRWAIIRNSWGASWGMGGYFTLSYDYLENQNLSSDWWAVELVGA